MSKFRRNAMITSFAVVGTLLAAAVAGVRSGMPPCASCPSQMLIAFLMGDDVPAGGAAATGSPAAQGKGGCAGAAMKAATLAADDDNKPCGAKLCDKAMADMPHVTYRVADLDTPCSKTADAASRDKQMPVKFVVGTEVFEDCGPAAARLAGLFEERVPAMAEIRNGSTGASTGGCPVSGQAAKTTTETKSAYTVAGVTFDSLKHAEAAQTSVKLALAKFEPGNAEGAAAGATSGCPHAAEAGVKSGCCKSAGGAAASTASDTAKAGGCSATGQAAKAGDVAKAAGGCCGAKGNVTTASDKPATAGDTPVEGGCHGAKTAGVQVASGVHSLGVCCDLNTVTEGGCCPDVQRLATVRTKVRALVEAAIASRAVEQTAGL